MAVTLTQDPANNIKTNKPVTIRVSSNTSIKEAKWIKGSGSAQEVWANGTAITDKSFTVDENGSYSVAVQDNEGQVEIKTIEIRDIDKIPPQPVRDLTVRYSPYKQKITLKWQNPYNLERQALQIICKKDNDEVKNETLSKYKSSFEINDITPDGSTYTLTVITKDEADNIKSSEPKTVAAIDIPEITEVKLDRKHLDVVQTDRAIAVTIKGTYFDRVNKLTVQVTEGNKTPIEIEALLDKPNNTATATIQAPQPEHPTDWGTIYTVKVLIDNETTPSDEIATFKVSNPAKVSSISLSPEKVPAGTSQPVTVTVKGTNLDIRSETTIRLLHLNESTPISGYPPIPVSPTPENETEFTATITQKPGGVSACIVAVYFKEAKQGKGKWLYLYGSPEITSVTIPKAGTSYAPNKLPVTIKGKNFNAPDIRFNGSGAVFTNFKVMSDTLATAEIECPSTAQTTEVTVTCKTSIGTSSKKSSLSITDFVTDHNRDYRTGKIVLADKTLINKESYTEINESNPPVGIVCTVYGVPRILALHISNRLRWDNNVYNGYGTQLMKFLLSYMLLRVRMQTNRLEGTRIGRHLSVPTAVMMHGMWVFIATAI